MPICHPHRLVRRCAAACTLAAAAAGPAHALLPSYPEATPEGLRAFGAGFLPATNIVAALPPDDGFIAWMRANDPFSTVLPKTSECSGTMIASDLLLTAAHCIPLAGMRYLGPDASGRFGLYTPQYGAAIGVGQGLDRTLTARLGAVDPGVGATWKGDLEVVALPQPGVGPDLAVARIQGRGGGVAVFSRLAGANEQYSLIDPASFGQPTGGRMLGGALAVGYSVDGSVATRERRGGIPMITPATRVITSDRGYTADSWVQDASFVDTYAGSPLPGSPGQQERFGNYRTTSIRLVSGDSGGPLLVQSTSGRRVLAGVAATASPSQDFRPGSGAGSATWTDLRPHTALLAAMQTAVRETPEVGQSWMLGFKPVSIDAIGAHLRSVFAAPASMSVQWFDPPAGHAEELRMLSGHGFTSVDFGPLDAQGARVLGRDSDQAAWQVLADQGAGDSAWTFGRAWRQLRLEGLGVAVGTDLTLGFSFETLVLGERTARFEWLGIDLLAPVPEPATAATLALGLGAVVALAARRRRSAARR